MLVANLRPKGIGAALWISRLLRGLVVRLGGRLVTSPSLLQPTETRPATLSQSVVLNVVISAQWLASAASGSSDASPPPTCAPTSGTSAPKASSAGASSP
jgi:hypothetical protein